MLNLLFQDEHICVIDKPSGYVVHKTRGAGQFPVVLQTLRDQIGQTVYPVHRLDRGTSGCLAFALSSETAKKLQLELSSNNAIKKYMTLCRGHLDSEGEFNRELFNENKFKQAALTRYRLIQSFNDYSLLEVQILTGRKHQIRRHLAYEGHQVIGDVNHGKGWLNRQFREKYDFHRIFLHCHFLFFLHPISGERISIHCEMTDELQGLLTQL